MSSQRVEISLDLRKEHESKLIFFPGDYVSIVYSVLEDKGTA